MNETSVDLALIGRLMRRRKIVFVMLAVIGAGLGAASSVVLSPGYVSTTKVLLQGSRSENEIPGETQVATSLVVLNKTADDLKWGITGIQLRGRVSAAIADGNVLTISGSAPTPQAAQQLSDKASAGYLNFSSQIISDAANASSATTQQARTALQAKVDAANKRITELQTSPTLNAAGADGDQARAEMQQAQRSVSEADKQLEQIDSAATTASLDAALSGATARIIEPATLPDAPSSPTLIELILGGAVVLVLLGVLAHLMALRSDRRLRHATEMGAAFGAPVLGVVATRAHQAQRSPLQRVLHDDRRWAYPGLMPVVDDARGRDARMRRALHKLGLGRRTGEILALVPTDDAVALNAVVDLAMAAAGSSIPVALCTDDDRLIQLANAVGAERGVGAQLSAGPIVPADRSALVILVARVVASQPTIPEAESSEGALLLVELGTRTGAELVVLAVASAIDAPRKRKSSNAAVSVLESPDSAMVGGI
jgi:capsular polysaccharide biosynthesis protein